MMWMTLLLMQAIDVQGPQACVSPAAIAQAVTLAGGIDEDKEHVSVVVQAAAATTAAASASPYQLQVVIRLVGTPPLERNSSLIAAECADVPDLVTFLLQTQRRRAQRDAVNEDDAPARGVLVETVTDSLAPEPQKSPPPPAQPAPELREAAADEWRITDGPPKGGLFGWRSSLGFGATWLGPRIQLDVRYAVLSHVEVTGLLSAEQPVEGDNRSLIGAGLALSLNPLLPQAWPSIVGISVHASTGLAVRNLSASGAAAIVAGECATETASTAVTTTTLLQPGWRAGARMSWGFVFAEVGISGAFGPGLRLDRVHNDSVTPPATTTPYLVVGLSPFG